MKTEHFNQDIKIYNDLTELLMWVSDSEKIARQDLIRAVAQCQESLFEASESGRRWGKALLELNERLAKELLTGLDEDTALYKLKIIAKGAIEYLELALAHQARKSYESRVLEAV